MCRAESKVEINRLLALNKPEFWTDETGHNYNYLSHVWHSKRIHVKLKCLCGCAENFLVDVREINLFLRS